MNKLENEAKEYFKKKYRIEYTFETDTRDTYFEFSVRGEFEPNKILIDLKEFLLSKGNYLIF